MACRVGPKRCEGIFIVSEVQVLFVSRVHSLFLSRREVAGTIIPLVHCKAIGVKGVASCVQV